jgi:hypothetical protein
MPQRANFNGYLRSLKRQRIIHIGKFKHLDRHPDIVLPPFNQDNDNDLEHRNALYHVGRLDKDDEAEKVQEEDEDEDDDE